LFKVKDISLAPDGELLIQWATDHMPVLNLIHKDFEKRKPLNGMVIGACLHATKETAVLVRTLEAGGARVILCGSNPLSTHDAVVSALASTGTEVFAWREQTNEEYYDCVKSVLRLKPNYTMDDGADLVSTLHSDKEFTLDGVRAGSEETTTGVIRLRAMHNDGALQYPIVAVNDTPTKHMFDNRYGTGQSTIDGILRATSILLAGKQFVVCGYGWCGKGIASRARGMGANVIVTEVDPLRALEAIMDGFNVASIKDICYSGDIFVTATGNKNVINTNEIMCMKDGVILANSGHFNAEINIPALENITKSKRTMRPNLVEYTIDGVGKIYLLGEGRLVNLVAAEGHPSEVMDMSFADQALVAEWVWSTNLNSRRKKLSGEISNLWRETGVYNVPLEIDEKVAKLKLESMGIEIDILTEEQEKYLSSWKAGTA
jgi:adenosylhomocysteinase